MLSLPSAPTPAPSATSSCRCRPFALFPRRGENLTPPIGTTTARAGRSRAFSARESSSWPTTPSTTCSALSDATRTNAATHWVFPYRLTPLVVWEWYPEISGRGEALATTQGLAAADYRLIGNGHGEFLTLFNFRYWMPWHTHLGAFFLFYFRTAWEMSSKTQI